MVSAVLACERVCVSYLSQAGRQQALSNVSLSAYPGEVVALTGPSGCGKSSLLKVLGGLLPPDQGQVRVGSATIDWTHEARTAQLRASQVGFVFQRFQLIPFLDVRRNVELPLRIRGFKAADRAQQVALALRFVGLEHKSQALPGQLSGGEQQRVAIARAVAGVPPILLCDEPTGSLNEAGARQIFDLLSSLATEHGRCVVMATHNEALADGCHRRLRLRDGHLVE